MEINPPFEKDDEVTAESQICTDVSPLSVVQIVQEAPSELPTPDPHEVYDGGHIVVVSQLVNGANVKIQNVTTGTLIGQGGAPSGHVRFNVSPPVADGDDLEVVQELCGIESDPGTETVKPCSDLPPPRLRAPSAGDVDVHLIEVAPGSRIRIYSDGEEIGDGGGSTIHLTRPLVEGETLIVVQIVDDCVSSTAYTLEVGRGLEDPADPGLCSTVERFEYGDSNDPEAQTTDVSSYFNSPDGSVTIPMTAVPLHGVVRYPSGPGPFPLILIVHGNHNPTELSYPGYDYLLDHLASHCMIAVSVEEDFLNGAVGGEMDARAIVMLRHLQLWRRWNQTPGHPFFTKVDMSRIGLAGHSRGGEAITAAKHFNTSLHNASDPGHSFNFAIRSLYAIAPVDGQFEGTPITLANADYYVMHGTHDGDVSDFAGHRMYDRAFPVASPSSNFKGLLWVHGANHAQWNEVWAASGDPFGISDLGPTGISVISKVDQQDIGRIYMTAFFLSGLKGWTEYNAFFAGDATFSSPPPSVTRVFQYQDPERVFINHYEEDDDVTTGSFGGVTNLPVGILNPYDDYSFSDQGVPHFLWGQTDGLILGWEDATNRELVINVPPNLTKDVEDYEFLAFRVGQTHESPSDLNSPGIDQDFTVQLKFGTLSGSAVRVSNYARLPYPIITDQPWWGGGPKSVKQTVRIPLEDLIEGLSEEVDLADLSEIRLKFDQHPSGLLAIDEIQFTQ